jgi:preprotein translocase subunit SecY
LQKHGGFIPGVSPGEPTAEYVGRVLSRITLVGAVYFALISLVPELLISYAALPFYFGGMSLLLVVCTMLDINVQVRSEAQASLGGIR